MQDHPDNVKDSNVCVYTVKLVHPSTRELISERTFYTEWEATNHMKDILFQDENFGSSTYMILCYKTYLVTMIDMVSCKELQDMHTKTAENKDIEKRPAITVKQSVMVEKVLRSTNSKKSSTGTNVIRSNIQTNSRDIGKQHIYIDEICNLTDHNVYFHIDGQKYILPDIQNTGDYKYALIWADDYVSADTNWLKDDTIVLLLNRDTTIPNRNSVFEEEPFPRPPRRVEFQLGEEIPEVQVNAKKEVFLVADVVFSKKQTSNEED